MSLANPSLPHLQEGNDKRQEVGHFTWRLALCGRASLWSDLWIAARLDQFPDTCDGVARAAGVSQGRAYELTVC